LTSVFGTVTVTRKAYRAVAGTPAAGSTSDATTGDAVPAPMVDPRVDAVVGEAKGAVNLYPGDAVLNLPVGRHSAGLARLVAVEAARGSFDEVVAAIARAGAYPVEWTQGLAARFVGRPRNGFDTP
jgi:hypothetical protein